MCLKLPKNYQEGELNTVISIRWRYEQRRDIIQAIENKKKSKAEGKETD